MYVNVYIDHDHIRFAGAQQCRQCIFSSCIVAIDRATQNVGQLTESREKCVWDLGSGCMLHYCHMGGVAEMDQNLKLFFLKAFVQPQDDSRQLEEGRGGSGCGPSGTSGRETQPEQQKTIQCSSADLSAGEAGMGNYLWFILL